jgi:hypothetical protein
LRRKIFSPVFDDQCLSVRADEKATAFVKLKSAIRSGKTPRGLPRVLVKINLDKIFAVLNPWFNGLSGQFMHMKRQMVNSAVPSVMSASSLDNSMLNKKNENKTIDSEPNEIRSGKLPN